MSADQAALFFGLSGSALYVGWGVSRIADEPHLTGALLCYALANLFLMWPVLRKFL